MVCRRPETENRWNVPYRIASTGTGSGRHRRVGVQTVQEIENQLRPPHALLGQADCRGFQMRARWIDIARIAQPNLRYTEAQSHDSAIRKAVKPRLSGLD